MTPKNIACDWYWDTGPENYASDAKNIIQDRCFEDGGNAGVAYDNAGWKCARHPVKRNGENFCSTGWKGYTDFKFPDKITDRSTSGGKLDSTTFGRTQKSVFEYLKGSADDADLTCCYNPTESINNSEIEKLRETHRSDKNFDKLYSSVMQNVCSVTSGAELDARRTMLAGKNASVLPLEGSVAACTGVAAERCAAEYSQASDTTVLHTAMNIYLTVKEGGKLRVPLSVGGTTRFQKDQRYALTVIDRFTKIADLTFEGEVDSHSVFAVSNAALNVPTGMQQIWIQEAGESARCARVDGTTTCFAMQGEEGKQSTGGWSVKPFSEFTSEKSEKQKASLASMIGAPADFDGNVQTMELPDEEAPLWVCPKRDSSVKGDGPFRDHTCSRLMMSRWGTLVKDARTGSIPLNPALVVEKKLTYPLTDASNLLELPHTLFEKDSEGSEDIILPRVGETFRLFVDERDNDVGTLFCRDVGDKSSSFVLSYDGDKSAPSNGSHVSWIMPAAVDIKASEVGVTRRCADWWSKNHKKLGTERDEMVDRICQNTGGTIPMECYCPKAAESPLYQTIANGGFMKTSNGASAGAPATASPSYCWWPACMQLQSTAQGGEFIRDWDDQQTCPNVCVINVNNEAGRDITMNNNTFEIEGCGEEQVGCDGCPGSGKVLDECGVCGGGGITGDQCACGMFRDACGVCGGDGSTCKGCDGIMGSNAIVDSCNVCGGKNESMDACGVCGGDGSTCEGCDGVMGSNVKVDACGECGGDGTTCDPSNASPPPDASSEPECPPRGGRRRRRRLHHHHPPHLLRDLRRNHRNRGILRRSSTTSSTGSPARWTSCWVSASSLPRSFCWLCCTGGLPRAETMPRKHPSRQSKQEERASIFWAFTRNSLQCLSP